MPDHPPQTARRTVSMPPSVAAEADRIAKKERRSVSAQLGVWVAEAVDAYNRGETNAEAVPAQGETRKRP